MSSDDGIAIRVVNLSKCYQIYERPQDRLRQSFVPRLQRLIGRAPKTYFREFWALKNVSFEVGKGETVGIIGYNGSGKSTLLQMICGILTPSGGRVEVNGRVAALLELGAGFNPEFTGRENVYMNGAILGLSRTEIDERFDDIAAFADIGDFLEQPIKTYSSGMYVRLAFAVVANVDAGVLVVDEALAVGDARFQQKCINRLNRLRDNGGTILFVSHALEQVKRFCSKAIWLDRGEMRAIGVASHICDQYDSHGAADRPMPDEVRTADGGPLAPEPKRMAKILSLGLAENQLAPFDALVVELEYEIFEERIDSLLLGVAIRRRIDNLYVFGPNTFLDGFGIPIEKGRHRLRYEIPRLPLLGGIYYVEAGLFSERGLVSIDFLPVAEEFSVKAAYFTEGLVHIEHRWTVVTHDEA
jgi:ABC-type polysaccharide/polyol phosphate transport system ATPase subunit